MSRFIVAGLASAMALTAVSSVCAAADPAPTPAPAAQAASPAPATQAAPAATPAAPAQVAKKKGPSPDDVICKPDAGTGSRVGGMKICLTRAEWRQRED